MPRFTAGLPPDPGPPTPSPNASSTLPPFALPRVPLRPPDHLSQGHVVYLKDAEVFWENIGGSLSLPLLSLETFDVDMGEGARIESIRIVNGQVALKARVVISPFPPLMVASLPKRAAFRYDVAERISVTFGNLVENIKILRLQLRPNRV